MGNKKKDFYEAFRRWIGIKTCLKKVPPSDGSKVITLKAGKLNITGKKINLLVTSSFAPSWYKDALNEGLTGKDRNSRQREILFAVCFAETYIFEWVRDNVFKTDSDGLIKCFAGKGLKEKWKVLNSLSDDKKIKGKIDFGKNINWQKFCGLIKLRNALVHASMSIPESSSPSDFIKQYPTTSDLNKYPNGLAVKVVYNLVKDLHEAVATSPPDWLCEP